MKPYRTTLAFLAVLCCAHQAFAQTLSAPYSSFYSLTNLGSVPGVPSSYGGLTINPSNTNQLLMGGSANISGSVIDSITVVRGAGGHITGFSGTAALFSSAAGASSGGIDGGLQFAPNGDLLFTNYSGNQIGMIKPGATSPSKFVSLTTLGVSSSVGGMSFVPSGFANAGHLKVASFSGGVFYDLIATPDGAGTYNLASGGSSFTLPFSSESFAFVREGNPGFNSDSVLINYWTGGTIYAYALDANANPTGTSQTFITGLSSAEGAAIDPVTGDYLFSSYGSGGVIVVRGFTSPVPEPSGIALAATAMLSCAGYRIVRGRRRAARPTCLFEHDAPASKSCPGASKPDA